MLFYSSFRKSFAISIFGNFLILELHIAQFSIEKTLQTKGKTGTKYIA